ncbi:hypothetical protein Nepgr_008791 [Nepenthes gracilis]|uniref:Uncharacterized protein n=1 Tax=Nepenthes gracilis TaxID=150966 RepID=A0AAD3SA94_NEPGR|nr:hypothetical protein Nepgr_008791 [Nepenthes gracilis]
MFKNLDAKIEAQQIGPLCRCEGLKRRFINWWSRGGNKRFDGGITKGSELEAEVHCERRGAYDGRPRGGTTTPKLDFSKFNGEDPSTYFIAVVHPYTANTIAKLYVDYVMKHHDMTRSIAMDVVMSKF